MVAAGKKLSSCICLTTEAAYIKLKSTFEKYIGSLITHVIQINPLLGNILQVIKNQVISSLIGQVPNRGEAFDGKPPTDDFMAITKWLKSSFPQRQRAIKAIRLDLRRFRKALLDASVSLGSIDINTAFDAIMKALNSVDNILMKTYNCYLSYFKGL